MTELLIPPSRFAGRIEDFGYQYLSFEARCWQAGEEIHGETEGRELAIVLLGGRCSVESSAGTWTNIGARANVFSGRPFTLYLPVGTSFRMSRRHGLRPRALLLPSRGPFPGEAGHAGRGPRGDPRRRQRHPPDPPHADAGLPRAAAPDRGSLHTGGNWSSYPPHKHDVHNPPGEVDLEEIYYYRIDRPEGYAIQRVYTADRRLDETLTVRDSELVLVPEGYHPVVAAHGYNVYYLNALAGSARSMAASDDPDYAWVRGTWTERILGCRCSKENSRWTSSFSAASATTFIRRSRMCRLPQVRRFSRYLGGSSANMAVGLARLGASVGYRQLPGKRQPEPVPDRFPEPGKVDTSHVQIAPGYLPSLCLTEVSPPDRFPQVFYRHDAADTRLDATDGRPRLRGRAGCSSLTARRCALRLRANPRTARSSGRRRRAAGWFSMWTTAPCRGGVRKRPGSRCGWRCRSSIS